METNKENNINKEGQSSDKQNMQEQQPKNQNQNDPIKDHTSQGHSTNAEGSATNSKEPTLRGSTTDSSRAHKNPHDDLPTGGNIR